MDEIVFSAMAPMKSLADEFLVLPSPQRAMVHFALGELALQTWNVYISVEGRIQYTESVVGTRQEVDRQLPGDALESAKRGLDYRNVAQRYEEPIAAMQADDLTFPAHITFAYYALYNLFRKYAHGETIDDWLIVNQALASEENSGKWAALFASAIQRAA